MKKEVLLYIFFVSLVTEVSLVSEVSLVTLILVNSNALSVTTNREALQNTTINQKLRFWKSFKNGKNLNSDSSTPMSFEKEYIGTNVNSFNGKNPTLEPSFQELQYEKERLRNWNLPTIQPNINYLQKIVNNARSNRKLNLDPYHDPTYNHYSHFNNFGQNLYNPTLYHKDFGIPNNNDRFIERKRYPKFLLENREDDLMDETVPLYRRESALLPKDTPIVPLSSASNEYRSIGTAVLNNKSDKNYLTKRNKESSNEKEFLERTSLNFENNNQTPSNLSEFVTHQENNENNEIQKQEITKLNDSDIDKSEIIYPHSDDFNQSKTDGSEQKISTPFHIVQVGFDRNAIGDDFMKGRSNKILYNRVYFEKVPQNLNLSWFVYVNCSRDRCLLSNSSDEVELLNEGWILHNCTHYGCTEMYPRTESIQKFIGLILLVFSLCVLKIIAFVLLFYYCRRMKLSKNAPDDKDELDEKKSTISGKKSLEKNNENDKSQTVSIDEFEPTFSNEESNNSNIAPPDKDGKKYSLAHQLQTDQNVTPCLVTSAPARNILNLNAAFGKKVHSNKISAVPKFRSNIPKLDRGKKISSDKMRTAKTADTKAITQNLDWKIPKRKKTTKTTSGGDGDILLMNLNDDEDNGSHTSGKSVKTLNWSTLLESECKSFISLDLNDEK